MAIFGILVGLIREGPVLSGKNQIFCLALEQWSILAKSSKLEIFPIFCSNRSLLEGLAIFDFKIEKSRKIFLARKFFRFSAENRQKWRFSTSPAAHWTAEAQVLVQKRALNGLFLGGPVGPPRIKFGLKERREIGAFLEELRALKGT